MKLLELFDPYEIHNLRYPTAQEVKKIDTLNQVVKIVKANCGEMVRAYKKAGRFIYRGVKNGGPEWMVTAIRKDRRPVEMPPDDHEKLHDAFRELGLLATRKNSIFCTTNRRLAGSWGDVYIIFVKDGWTGTVFDDVQAGYAFGDLSIAAEKYADNPKKLKAAIEEMKPVTVTPNNLFKYIVKEYEDILISGDSYIGVSARHEGELRDLLGMGW